MTENRGQRPEQRWQPSVLSICLLSSDLCILALLSVKVPRQLLLTVSLGIQHIVLL
jgi:hypothetical protein